MDGEVNDGESIPDKVDATWMIDEGVPGPGERPEWLPDKFKTVKDAMNSRSELEKRLGAAPPEEYDYGEYGEAIDKDHDAFKDLAAFSKEKRVPQEVFTKVLESVKKYGESFMPDSDTEMAKLGDDGSKRVEILGNWIDANLSEETSNLLKPMIGDYVTADSVKALEEIRGKFMESSPTIPNGSQGNSADMESVKDLEAELQAPGNLDKFTNDLVYRKDWQSRVARASKSSGYVDKAGS